MPKKASGKPNKKGYVALTVRLKKSTWDALDKKAKEGPDKNYWVNQLLDQFLDRVDLSLRLKGERLDPWDGETERRKGDRRKLGA